MISAFTALFFLHACSLQSVRPDSDVTEAWVTESVADGNEPIPAVEATAFTKDFFDLFDAAVFDPAYRRSELAAARSDILAEIVRTFPLTRNKTIKILNQRIRALGFSHLAAIPPEKAAQIVRMSGGAKNAQPEAAVSAEMRGEFGIIRVKSFLVPSITLAQVEAARAKVKDAKYLIYDLRDNGGGSVSSNSYLIETLLGPGKTIQLSRSRDGMDKDEPYLQEGFFADEKNAGSKADIALEEEKSFVEWRTRSSAVKDPRKTLLLVNGGCASSCDVFAAAVKEHGAAKIVGTKTAGSVLGGIAFKTGWRGYVAILPVSQLISPNGKLYEGIGIEPDVKLTSCAESKNASCLTEAMKQI